MCHFEDINAEIDRHPLESDTQGGPHPLPPRSYATGLINLYKVVERINQISRRICQPKRNTYHDSIMPNNPHDIAFPLSVPNTYLLMTPKEEEKNW